MTRHTDYSNRPGSLSYTVNDRIRFKDPLTSRSGPDYLNTSHSYLYGRGEAQSLISVESSFSDCEENIQISEQG